MRRSLALLACVMACWKPVGPARPPQREPQLDVTSVQLDNGLRVVVVPDPHAAEVQVLVHYGVGYADDPPGREGTAHLTEHLSFQRVRDGRSLYADLARVATAFNAQTESDATTFVARAAPDRLGELLAIEAARVTLPCAPDATAARERAVVTSELRQYRPARTVVARLNAAFYGDHHDDRDGESETSLGAISAADACAFAVSGYRPDDAAVVLSGALPGDALRTVRATLGAVPRHPYVAAAVGRAPAHRSVTETASIDAPVIAFGWPLPIDPAQRARVLALGDIIVDHLADELNGELAPLVLGGDRSPILAIAIVAAPDETTRTVLGTARRVIGGLARSLNNTSYYDESFDHVHGAAIAGFVAALEDGGGGPFRLAEHALAGRDPRAALMAELRSLETMDHNDAVALAGTTLSLDRASTLVLEPDHARRRAEPLQLALARHTDPPTELADPAAAERPEPPLTVASPLAAARTRTLPGGAQVVLLPVSSMPSVDVRFIYATGTGDEPSDQPGIATLAAAALSPHAVDIPELLRFFEGGGNIVPDTTLDHTSFRSHGLERDLDRTLSALGRWLDGGHYGALGQAVQQLHRLHRDPREAAVNAAWRVALFGWDHAYARSPDYARLSARDVQLFRAMHYSGPGLTIVVAGGFDPAVANAWIDQVAALGFGGKAANRPGEPTKLAAATLGFVEDSAQVELHIAIPADGERAHQLLVAALLDDAVSDVRFQLAASYGVYANLGETRLGSWYEIDGYVDAARIAEAVALIRGRIAALRTADRATAARFLRARRTVMTRLAVVPTSARALADRAESVIGAGHTLDDELETAGEVRITTLSAVAPQLTRLDLAAAAMLLRGPKPAIDAATAGLGRKPQYIE
jgi:zinc protease